MLRLARRGALLAAGLAALLAAPAAAQAPAPAMPALRWSPCTDSAQAGFDCARMDVPLDHARPAGDRISLSVVRHRAEDQARRIGTLFFNPGGPGGQGTRDLPAWLSLFPAPVRAAFDLISWDPRGIGESAGIQCFPNAAAEAAFFQGVPADSFPVGESEIAGWIARFAAYARLCAARNGNLLAHVSTADTARDLDLLREAVGEARLSYLGVSYGTVLGATYANLFPDRVRAMVLDGNVSPTAWAEPDGELSTGLRLLNDVASARTLEVFLDLCGAAKPGACAFSAATPAATRARFDALLDRLRAGPVSLRGTTITYAALLGAVQGQLFTVQPRPPGFRGWAGLAALLQEVASAPAAAPVPAPAAAPVPAPPAALAPAGTAEETYTSALQGMVVECSDSPNPRERGAFIRLGRFAAERGGPIGPMVSWSDEPCAAWPATAPGRYAGPWDRATTPVLVIGNDHDPATDYRNAVAMAAQLGRARLLRVEGYGHTMLLNPSRCGAAIVSAYLIAGTLPPEGTVCRQDAAPFE